MRRLLFLRRSPNSFSHNDYSPGLSGNESTDYKESFESNSHLLDLRQNINEAISDLSCNLLETQLSELNRYETILHKHLTDMGLISDEAYIDTLTILDDRIKAIELQLHRQAASVNVVHTQTGVVAEENPELSSSHFGVKEVSANSTRSSEGGDKVPAAEEVTDSNPLLVEVGQNIEAAIASLRFNHPSKQIEALKGYKEQLLAYLSNQNISANALNPLDRRIKELESQLPEQPVYVASQGENSGTEDQTVVQERGETENIDLLRRRDLEAIRGCLERNNDVLVKYGLEPKILKNLDDTDKVGLILPRGLNYQVQKGKGHLKSESAIVNLSIRFDVSIASRDRGGFRYKGIKLEENEAGNKLKIFFNIGSYENPSLDTSDMFVFSLPANTNDIYAAR